MPIKFFGNKSSKSAAMPGVKSDKSRDSYDDSSLYSIESKSERKQRQREEDMRKQLMKGTS
jgi:hypothetical protein